jgi:hypothetical protein
MLDNLVGIFMSYTNGAVNCRLWTSASPEMLKLVWTEVRYRLEILEICRATKWVHMEIYWQERFDLTCIQYFVLF